VKQSRSANVPMSPSWAAPFRTLVMAAVYAAAMTKEIAAQEHVFYALGSPESASKDVRLYEVDSATLQVVRSLSVQRQTPNGETVNMTSGMLSGTRDAILLTDGQLQSSSLLRVSAPALESKGQWAMKDFQIQGAMCLDHIFVHPVTSLAYFSCDTGSGGNGFVILDTSKSAVAGDFPHDPPTPSSWPHLSLFRPAFVYAPKSKRLYLVGKNVLALDSENHAVDYISVREIAKSANVATVREIDNLAVLANGDVVLLTDKHRSPALILYDPVARKVLQHWSETQKYSEMESYTDSRTGKNEERLVQKIARIRCGPVASRDGSRLFAVSEGDIVLWDANTLEELGRLDAPEPPDSNGGECFHSAPDGSGLWYLGQSGKVYRLDDRTGKFIEEVKFPFHLISLIREP
jgi:hypothetical protein